MGGEGVLELRVSRFEKFDMNESTGVGGGVLVGRFCICGGTSL